MKEENIGVIGTLKISKRLQKIIDYLHYKIGSVEWSGVLYYKLTKGNLEDLEDLEFEATFMYPMNIGSSTYTEFDYNGELVSAYDIFEEGLEQSTSLIHTHHSMGAFHSGTDLKELTDNADKYNYYLSLVVNFSHTYCAKLAIPSTEIVNYTSYIKNQEGKLVNFHGEREEKILLIGDLNIVFEEEVTNESWLDERIKTLQEKSKEQKIRFKDANVFDIGLPNFGFDRFKENLKSSISATTEVTTDKFLASLLSLNEKITDSFEAILKLHLDATEEELDILEEALESNYEIIHENLYGMDADIRSDSINALHELNKYLSKYGKYKIFDVLDLILSSYVAI
jgi:hypothetical protein